MAYLFPIIFSIICIIVYDMHRTEKFSRIMFWGMCVYLILLFGLSDDLGYDTTHLYHPAYQSFPTFASADMWDRLEEYSGFGYGFQFFILIFKTLGLPWWCFQLAVAGIINVTVFYFINRHLNYRFIAILLYITCLSMRLNVEIIRQSLAMMVFLMSYPFLTKRQWGYFFISVLVATLFHTSAFMLLLVPLMYLMRIDINRRLIYAFVAMSIVVYLISLYLYDVSKIFGSTYSEKIIYYAYTRRYERNLNYYIYHSLCNALLPLAVGCYYKFILKRDIPFSRIIAILPLLLPGILAFGESFIRLGYYFLPFFMFSSAELTGEQIHRRELKNKLCGIVICVVLMVSYSYELIKSTTISDKYYPYRTILTHTEQAR